MFLSWNWLREFIDVDASVQEVAERLTVSGSEIESLRRSDEGVSGLVIAHCVEHFQHPTKSGLTVTRLDVGDGNPRLVVTAAKNVKLGDKLAYAISGSKVKSGLTLGMRDFDGFVSDGMMGSAAEIGIPELAKEPGILILPEDAPIGSSVIEYLGLDDWILELSITPNRGDLLSYVGVAREIKALFPKSVLKPLSLSLKCTQESLPDELQAPQILTQHCQRYALGYVDHLTGKAAPLQDQVKLIKSGIHSVSGIVDATNMTMLMLGQPLHAFDLDKLPQKQLSVAQADEGEKFVSLDGKERVLSADDLVIRSGGQTVALAGVMGGQNSEIDDATQRTLVESASFNAPSIMRCSRRLGLNSEASYRMARGIDPSLVIPALDCFASLVEKWDLGTVYKEKLQQGEMKTAPKKVGLSKGAVQKLTGREDLEEKVEPTLTALGFQNQGDQWIVPSYRLDISIEEDLIEEVARLHGYNEGMPSIPKLHGPGSLGAFFEVWSKLRQVALGRGYCECVTYSFVSPSLLEQCRLPVADCLRLSNPLSVDLSAMRSHVFPSLLLSAERSIKRGWRKPVCLFEVGKAFILEGEATVEQDHACGVVVAPFDPRSVYGPREEIDFYRVKSDVETLINRLGFEVKFVQDQSLAFGHSGRSALLKVNEKVIGFFAQLKPVIAEGFDFKTNVFVYEFDLSPLLNGPAPVYKLAGDFPPAYRDVAFLADVHDSAVDLAQLIKELGSPLATEVRLFDLYQGQGIPEGKKSLAFSVAYRRDDRTLRDEEVEAQHAQVRKGLEARGYDLR